MLAAAVASLTANAQVKLDDKNANAYDLGYGVETSSFLSTAASTTITGEELQQTSATNLAQALYGRLPGLTALAQGGFTGDENNGASFNIRGYHTLNDNSILILVDGYERPIDRLSVEEVESVTILKDAAATALLGHEGVNGAILVKTKRGTSDGKHHVSVSYDHKFTFNPSVADFVDAYTYANALRAVDNRIHKDVEVMSYPKGRRGYYRGYFTLGKTGDTFLDMQAFGKGLVYVNGHAIGRYWNIGPQQTLYVPGCWLKKGRNEVIVLDVIGPAGKAVCSGRAEPELDKLNITSPATHRKPGETLDTKTLPLAAEGSFAPGNGWQTVKLASPRKGRYVAIEGLNAHDGKQLAAIAELYVLDAGGKRLSREPWTVKYADSEDVSGGNYMADKVFDLQESTYWQTDRRAKFPHVVVIDLGSEQTVTAVEYLPRAEQGAPAGLKDYRVYVY